MSQTPDTKLEISEEMICPKAVRLLVGKQREPRVNKCNLTSLEVKCVLLKMLAKDFWKALSK